MKKEPVELSDDELRKMHMVQLQMFQEFDRLCRKYNIKYILEGGSLLGAVRHKGFIPWDDDMDIRMLRSEYDRFCQVLKELSPEMFFQNYATDREYPWLYAKIRMNGTKAVRIGQESLNMHGGIFIDIFPCDGVPDNERERKRHNGLTLFCRKVLYARTARYTSRHMLERIGWTMVCLIPKKVAFGITERLARKYTQYNCKKVGIMGWHGIEDAIGFPIEYFTEMIECEFEGCAAYIPREYDAYLKYTFGEKYMDVPPLEKQIKDHGIVDFDLGKFEQEIK